MQMLPVYWIVLVKCCKCSHNLCWLQKLCPNLRTFTQHSGCKCLSPPWKHSAEIYARWYNDSALFCHSFLYFWRCFCTHQRVDSCFLLINLATRSECYFVCFLMCDAFYRLRDASNGSQSWIQSLVYSLTRPTHRCSGCISEPVFRSNVYQASQATKWPDLSATFTDKRSITVCIWVCTWILSSDSFCYAATRFVHRMTLPGIERHGHKMAGF